MEVLLCRTRRHWPGDWVTGKATYQVEPEVGGDHLVLLVLSQQKEATR